MGPPFHAVSFSRKADGEIEPRDGCCPLGGWWFFCELAIIETRSTLSRVQCVSNIRFRATDQGQHIPHCRWSNNLSTLTLLPFILYGPCLFLFFSNSLLGIFLSIIIYVTFFLITYYLVNARVNEIKN